MTEKMQNEKIKESESILKMTNASVSHELRNPINSIID